MIFKAIILLYLYFIQNLISNELKLSNKHEQVHLSLAKNPRTMIISWTTFYDLLSKHRKPTVRYGITGRNLYRKKYGHTKKLKESKNPKMIRYFHRVYLKNLHYNTRYYYKVGDGKTWSKIFHFQTFPQGQNFSIKFCVLGDMDTGKMYTINRLIKAAKDRTCQFVIHVGDIAYQLQKDDGFVGDEFMNRIEPIAAYIPYMVIEGNHEFDCTGFSHYDNRFVMPLDKNNIKKIDHFYSFNVGLVNFIALSTEIYGLYTIFGPNPINRQIKWLNKTLKKIEISRNVRPWTISYFHRPIYCWHKKIKGECNEYESSTLRIGYKNIPGLENYFYHYNVDLVFYGHEHGYERNYPVYNRTIYEYSKNIYYNSPAPIYILSGAGGCKRCTPAIYNDSIKSPFSAKRTNEVGYTRVHVINHTHIKVVQIGTEYNTIEDILWIIKNFEFNMGKSKITKKPKRKYKPYIGAQEYQYIEKPYIVQKCVNLYNISLFKSKHN